jgi:hypothetical protein
MNLLASAIPGLREIRAPLVAGYLWLIFAWLVVDPSLPLAQNTAGPVHSLVELANVVGGVATAAAVSVGAYLIGAVSASVTDEVARRALLPSRLPPTTDVMWKVPDVGDPFVPWEPKTQRVPWEPKTQRFGLRRILQPGVTRTYSGVSLSPLGRVGAFIMGDRIDTNIDDSGVPGSPSRLARRAADNPELSRLLLDWLEYTLPRVKGGLR